MGQVTLEESFACWHTCISTCFLILTLQERKDDSKCGTKNKLSASDALNGYFGCRDIITTLEMSLGNLEGPARKSFPSELR